MLEPYAKILKFVKIMWHTLDSGSKITCDSNYYTFFYVEVSIENSIASDREQGPYGQRDLSDHR